MAQRDNALAWRGPCSAVVAPRTCGICRGACAPRTGELHAKDSCAPRRDDDPRGLGHVGARGVSGRKRGHARRSAPDDRRSRRGCVGRSRGRERLGDEAEGGLRQSPRRRSQWPRGRRLHVRSRGRDGELLDGIASKTQRQRLHRRRAEVPENRRVPDLGILHRRQLHVPGGVRRGRREVRVRRERRRLPPRPRRRGRVGFGRRRAFAWRRLVRGRRTWRLVRRGRRRWGRTAVLLLGADLLLRHRRRGSQGRVRGDRDEQQRARMRRRPRQVRMFGGGLRHLVELEWGHGIERSFGKRHVLVGVHLRPWRVALVR